VKNIAFLAAVFAASVLAAQTNPPRPELSHNLNSVWFDNWIGLSNATLRVAAPNGKVDTVYDTSRSPVYRLSGGRIQDGVYRYELRAATDERIAADPNRAQNGDGNLSDDVPKPFYLTGAFIVKRGAIVTPEAPKQTRDGN